MKRGDGPARRRNVFVRWLGYLRPYLPVLCIAYTALLLLMGIDVALPKALGFVIDGMLKGEGIASGEAHLPLIGRLPVRTAFLVMLSVLLALMAVRVGLMYARNQLLVYIGERIHVDIRKQLFDHLQRLPISYFDKSYTGRIMARITTDTDALWHLLHGGSINVLAPLLTVTAVLVILFRLHAALTLLLLLVMPVVAVLFYRARRKAKAATEAQRETLSTIYSRLQEQISGIRIVRLFGRGADESRTFLGDLRALYGKNVLMLRTYGKLAVKSEFVTGGATVAVLCLGGIAVTAGQLSVGQLVQFYIYAGMLFAPLQQITNTSAQVFTAAQVALSRIYELLDQPEAEETRRGGSPCPPLKGAITVRDLTFGYETGQAVLDCVSLDIAAGETVAFVGPSGVGKTTLVNLVCRFYHFDKGRIEIDGIDISGIDVESYRRHISYVTQDSFMFTGTVADNIRYARSSATREEVEEAARLANAHEFIVRMPRGYDTEIGERAVTLSGGQKQRLNIARALIRKPSILIMDEPTSSLDAESESILLEALQTVFRRLTCIIIAHRLSTVMSVNRIFVLNQGRVVQQGRHDELLLQDGLYQDLCRKQFVGYGGGNGLESRARSPEPAATVPSRTTVAAS